MYLIKTKNTGAQAKPEFKDTAKTNAQDIKPVVEAKPAITRKSYIKPNTQKALV